jgi:hypothetical protein
MKGIELQGILFSAGFSVCFLKTRFHYALCSPSCVQMYENRKMEPAETLLGMRGGEGI